MGMTAWVSVYVGVHMGGMVGRARVCEMGV